jgi:hypothetical protein
MAVTKQQESAACKNGALNTSSCAESPKTSEHNQRELDAKSAGNIAAVKMTRLLAILAKAYGTLAFFVEHFTPQS